MYVRSATDVGALIRDRRRQLDLDQATLARRIGVSRQWVSGIERGRVRAELRLVLRVLGELGFRLDARLEDTKQVAAQIIPAVDIDAIVTAARKAKC